MKKILSILLITLILLVGTVSALDWDNSIRYENKDMRVVLENMWGYGSDLGYMDLASHNHSTQILKVSSGTNKVPLYYDSNFEDLYKDGLGEVIFTNQTTGETIIKDYKYVYQVLETKERNIYKKDCIKISETKEDCTYTSIGKEEYQELVWKDYNSLDIPKGNIRIGVMTDVNIGDWIDAVIVIGGEEVSKHAEWTADLNVNLIFYIKLNESTGSANSTIFSNSNNLSTVTVTQGAPGLIGTAYSSILSAGQVEDNVTGFPQTDTNFTFRLWSNASIGGSNRHLIGLQDPSGDGNRIQIWIDGTYKLRTDVVNTSDFDTGVTPTLNTWEHVIFTYDMDTNNLSFYLNGVFTNSTLAPFLGTAGNCFSMFQNCDGNFPSNGSIDEVAIWNRSLTPAEITQDYNGGIGITWQGTFPPNITLEEPPNDADFLIPTITFNCTVDDGKGVKNVSLLINGTVEQTNTSGINNTKYEFPETITTGEGFYNWTCQAYDINDEIRIADARNFTISNNIAITLNNPINAFNSTSQNIIFNITGSDDTTLQNISIIINATYNGTNSSVVNNTLTQFPRVLADGFYNWTGEACDNLGVCVNATERNISIDATLPFVNTTQPLGTLNYNIEGGNFTFNATSTDLNLDSCWFDYDFTNTTYTCNTNLTNITLTDQRNITSWANDTFGNENSSLSEWDYRVLEINQSFNNQTTEGNIELYNATVKILSGLTISSVEFIYNETTFSGSSFISGDFNILRRTNFSIPSIAADINFTFFWNVTLSDGSEINISSNNQTVFNLDLDNCTTNTITILNFTMLDEESQEIINQTNNTVFEVAINVFDANRENLVINESGTFVNNPTAFCLNIELSNSSNYSLDTIVRYESDGRVSEYFNIVDFRLTNETEIQNISLYDLNTSDSTDFQLTFTGSDFLPVEEALVFVDRQYIEDNDFKTVELPRTDSNGQTILHMVRNSIIYNLRIVKDGVVLGNFENIIAFCEDFTIGQCEIILNAFDSTEAIFNYNEDLGLIFTSPTYNATLSRISFNFLTADGTSQFVSMNVSRNDIFGNRSICNSSLTSSGGTLICDFDPNLDETILRTDIFLNDEIVIQDNVRIDTENQGAVGYLIFLVMAISFIFLFSESKTGVLFGMLLSFLGAVGLGLISNDIIGIGASGLWLIIIIFLGMWQLNKEKRQ